MRPPSTSELCVICKGSRLLCGKASCPILMYQLAIAPFKKVILSKEIFGSSPPALFVGRYNYPQVSAGPLIPPYVDENAQILNEPDLWFGTPINTIVNYRTSLVRSVFPVNVKKPQSNRFLETSQLIIMAKSPVDTEATFEKEPRFRLEFDSYSQPMGPIGKVEKVTIAENPKIHPRLDYVVSDTDLKATAAAMSLYEMRFSVTQINQLLSAGLLGTAKYRKLVPTRWSITAVDSIVSKSLVQRIKNYPEINEHLLFESNYLDNHFKILLIPSSWSFEQLEAWYPGSAWVAEGYQPIIVNDYEFYAGRKEYASKVAGAYYAARLAVGEYLIRIGRQAAVLILREVRPGYVLPLGVWQIRENVRNAMKTTPKRYESFEDALKAAGRSLIIPLERWLAKSHLYDFFKRQARLDTFIKT
ncbi:MAG: Nre family DNA repair protein [Candidatus Hodarchaeota archaeon]